MKALLLALLLVTSAPAWAADASSAGTSQPSGNAQDISTRPLTPEERAQPMQELQDLRARMTRLENVLGIAPAVPTAVPPAEVKPKGDNNLELYGFLQTGPDRLVPPRSGARA